MGALLVIGMCLIGAPDDTCHAEYVMLDDMTPLQCTMTGAMLVELLMRARPDWRVVFWHCEDGRPI